ncbi:PTS sugar transporter subunit IIA [Selenomonas ruminantium]|uniref:PTS system, galactitol-specific IIA component n=1 Tax=Selenomonas ruminantium TaxID=971 RepID=A0A1H4A4K7_SELRU|nr:PTS sugar transporter subunit IIA [Selenomonas ruminantium]SEA30482.1 PTS system, galactitol-specific IIA component [Selenomonas ruminantium]
MQEVFFQEDLVLPEITVNNSNEAIKQTGEVLHKAGFVSEEYVESVLKRESSFPTGLQLAGLALAIPHATPEGNVAKNGIAVGRLTTPVYFQSMENPEKEVAAEYIFMLALKDSERHLEVLKQLFASLQKPSVIAALKGAKTKAEIMSVVEHNFLAQ